MMKILVALFIFVCGFLAFIVYSHAHDPKLIPALLVLVIGVGGTTALFWREMNKQPNNREVKE